jgi:TonB family protein
MNYEGFNQNGDKKPRLINRVEAEYSEDARAKKIEGVVALSTTIDSNGVPQDITVTRSLYPSLDQKAVEALSKWRFEPATKNGQPVPRHLSIEMVFNVDRSDKIRSGEARVMSEEEIKQRTEQAPVFEVRKRKDLVEQGREERSRRQTELTRLAGISMDRAIQIALSQFPGKVLACSLGRDGDKVFYHLVIINAEGEKSTTTYVWIGATDGQIIKSENERQ